MKVFKLPTLEKSSLATDNPQLSQRLRLADIDRENARRNKQVQLASIAGWNCVKFLTVLADELAVDRVAAR